jgi:hypothetical protein
MCVPANLLIIVKNVKESYPWPLGILLGPFKIFMKILGGIRNFVFIAGVVVTGNKLSAVSLTPVIRPCSRFSSIR